MFLSIVIPAYNSEKTIVPLLVSLVRSKKVDFGQIEIVVVDDCSQDKTVEKIIQAIDSWAFFPQIKIIKLKKNQGPAAARNIGVKYAKGKVVLFLDSDVLVYRNTLYEVLKSFENDLDLYALTGVWDKKQRSKKFFPKFKALRDWSYWINERDPKNYYYLFSTRVAAIRRDLFLRLGGFDTRYRYALIEDIELTYRIAKRYAVVFNPKVIVRHEFENFWPVAKKYFWRSFYWSKIYRERRKFDPVATTGKEALTTISAGGLVGSLVLGGGIELIRKVGLIGLSGEMERWFWILSFAFLVLHLLGVRKFLLFVTREEGLIFAVKSFFVGLVLYLIILTGAAASFFNFRAKT